ncbi:MAG: NAD(P)H-hydrate dehydratase [Candidatus Thorarchaeota archaeon]
MKKNNEISSELMSVYDVNSEWFGVSRQLLMENAGSGIAREIRSFKNVFENKSFKSIAIFCGTGGNGGDGFVLARHLYGDFNVTVFLLGYPERISSVPAKNNWDALARLPSLEVKIIRDSSELTNIDLQKQDVIIDALLGSGLRFSPRNPHATAIEIINKFHDQGKIIWSIDLPSGLLENGELGKPSVNPDCIFSLHQPKMGTLNFKSVVNIPIGIPLDAIIGSGPGYFRFFRTRDPSSHKGDNGTALIIAGSKDYHGATILSANAMLKTGIDLITIVCPQEIAPTIRNANSEFIVHPYNFSYFCKDIVYEIISIAVSKSVVLLGPGLGNQKEVEEGINLFIDNWAGLEHKPGLVIDADALKFLSKDLKKFTNDMIVTPHAGEFFSLTNVKLSSCNKLPERKKQINKITSKYQGVWLVKGKVDLIVNESRLIQNNTGCSAMTIGGTGDVLAGVTAGLFARSKKAFYSAIVSAFWVGLTGEYTALQNSGFSTNKLIENLPIVWKEINKFIDDEENNLKNLSFK